VHDDHKTGPLPMHLRAAAGLESLEKEPFQAYYVVDAEDTHGEDLAKLLDHEHTVLTNLEHFVPHHFQNQVNILARRGPVRVVFRNLHRAHPHQVHAIEKIFDREENYPIKSAWFVDDGKHVDSGFRHRVLMRCEMIDSSTLLDALAFGFGAKNPYTGDPVGAEAMEMASGLEGPADKV
jgi:hypothetical protein